MPVYICVERKITLQSYDHYHKVLIIRIMKSKSPKLLQRNLYLHIDKAESKPRGQRFDAMNS